MDYFIITNDTCNIGFQYHTIINLSEPIGDQLHRRELYNRNGNDKGNIFDIKKIIERNASLRVDFGWSFESTTHYKTIMDDCIADVFPKFNVTRLQKPFGALTSDLRCSWLGFVPFNIFEKSIFDDMTLSELINFNNELIKFQINVIEFIIQHKIFRQHSLLRDELYRFGYFKNIRKDPLALSDAYNYYINAVKDACSLTSISRDLLELEIGCHFLYQPDLFFQLLNFSILQGTVHE